MAKILLVEDNELNRDMLKRRLERRGHEISIAVDGAEGVEKATSEKPDLILMDLNLPILDGWEATRQIKANEETGGIGAFELVALHSTDHGRTWSRPERMEVPDDLIVTPSSCLLYTSPSPRDGLLSRMPSSA